jgi:alpha-beta hydrolase superfamily lysophospholipase
LIERSFAIDCAGERVPGVLWTPDDESAPRPLVLAGHGFTLHKRALFPPSLVADLTGRGFAVASIDAPGHGERQPDGGADRAASDRAWREHWRQLGATRIAAELSAALDWLESELEVSAVGYWGLSLGTQHGVGWLASEPRVTAAVLGLSGLPEPGPRIAAYAAGVHCPVFFIQQLDDEVCPADRSQALFDRLGTAEKTLRSSPGFHTEVPTSVFEEAFAFLEARLQV